MICKVEKTIEKFSMLKSGQTVAVGVSGGADSVCLLHVLSKIRAKYDIVVKAVHINHNIRGTEAKRDEDFVRDFCKKIGVEFILFSRDIPALSKELSMSEEECGRKVRYECFASVEADVIATAHTLSDSAETVLFNLARGSGIKGLGGIAPVRGNIIRPLIELTRQDIEQYCFENELDFVTDSTNLSDDYTRNKIRHNVIPVLRGINPGFEKNIGRLSSCAREDEHFLTKCACELLEKSKMQEGWSLENFSRADVAVKKRALLKILSDNMNKEPESKHVQLCMEALETKKSVEIAKDLYICFDGDIISLRKKCKENAAAWSVSVCLGENTAFNGGTLKTEIIEKHENQKYDTMRFIDADELDLFRLTVRSRNEADKFSDIRRKNTKTLKKLFYEKHIPKEKRNDIAVLSHDNTVVWVEGFGTDAKFVVNEKTKKVIAIDIVRQKTEDDKNV